LQESYANLDRLDQDLVQSQPDNPELLKSILRTIPTIEGTCGFLGLYQARIVGARRENLLSVLRDGQLRLNTEIKTALLAMLDEKCSRASTVWAMKENRTTTN